MVKYRGDTVTFDLTLSEYFKGTAFLRTNIGHAEIARKEIIQYVEYDKPPLEQDWFDVPMVPQDERHFKITLALCDVGHFEAKAFFLPADQNTPVWAPGANTVVNVSPADTCCANIIYNAFVRQFGPNKHGTLLGDSHLQLVQPLDEAGYTVIPPSGTFRDLIRELDFIIAELGCRLVQLLPINPTPTTYGRMGRFGSPYAALSFTAVDPALAEFDPKATPLDQFIELIDAIHARNARVLIDIAINHTGWAAGLHETHPQWLARDAKGKIEVPGAWGIQWADLTKLDYGHKDLWRYMGSMFLTWCRRGVDGFRCDAGYMIPVSAWKYIIARVREQFPDTIFLLEGLGGKVSVSRDLLNLANFTWAYSELFQNYDRPQIENYLPQAIKIADGDGTLVHYAETHDNNRLASRSPGFARMRTALCALTSLQGAFGFANGVEWYATEKIDVHQAPSLNWGAEINQIKEIRTLNSILRHHPVFFDQTELKLIQHGQGNFIVLLRHNLPTGKRLLVLANLDDENPQTCAWDPLQAALDGNVFFDLLTEKTISITRSGGLSTTLLAPAEVLCLSTDETDLALVKSKSEDTFQLPERMLRQHLRAKALDVLRHYKGLVDLQDFRPDPAARQLFDDPLTFCRSLNQAGSEAGVILWHWPRDTRREVMLPPDHFLLVRAAYAFRARIEKNRRVLQCEESLPCADGSHFAIFSPFKIPNQHTPASLNLSLYHPDHCQHSAGPLLFLAHAKNARLKWRYGRNDLRRADLSFLATDGRGGMLKAAVNWAQLGSRYDALLAANPHPEFPVDRWIMLTRCRLWVVHEDYSQEIGAECFESFTSNREGKGLWRFKVPVGGGAHVRITLKLEIIPAKSTVRMLVRRSFSNGRGQGLGDLKPVRVIVRPAIENRNFHAATKAYTGPEHLWPRAVHPNSKGFTFRPDHEHTLEMQISAGTFVAEPEWTYMVHRPHEVERGLDPDSDLFSPGYFETFLAGNQSVCLAAQMPAQRMPTDDFRSLFELETAPGELENDFAPDFVQALQGAMDSFVVRRGDLKTVIAGYPWFLDWGRDALIFARGLIAAGRIQTVREILQQFGRFEKEGTLPNMIQGNNAENRDTSDAPLWFCVVCAELLQAENNPSLLEVMCGDRTLREILFSIGNNFRAGTPNGIGMDPDSGLIFSPAHFTWMDTDHPAGTPRQGYPIEIQVLWYAALKLLSSIAADGSNADWRQIAHRVRSSIKDLFYLNAKGYLSDCLHTTSGKPAREAAADDALRPNQLLAITLGAIADAQISRKIVSACEELLVPGAIRSLADRPVTYPLKIVYQGRVINDPHHPYQGNYRGNEDTRRKPAYHNGTAWTWLFPSFCEAWAAAHGESGKESALAWLSSSVRLLNQGCIGHVPEILDGDFPHIQRGCNAQAWGMSELVRVWMRLAGT